MNQDMLMRYRTIELTDRSDEAAELPCVGLPAWWMGRSARVVFLAEDDRGVVRAELEVYGVGLKE